MLHLLFLYNLKVLVALNVVINVHLYHVASDTAGWESSKNYVTSVVMAFAQALGEERCDTELSKNISGEKKQLTATMSCR